MLRRLLDAIAALKTHAAISVLVADNDAESHAGLDLCRSLTDYPWPLTAVIAEKRGIAQVRNTLIEQALKGDAQFIAMIDDDEWPDPHWISHFLAVQKDTGADALQGSILFGDAAMPDIRRATAGRFRIDRLVPGLEYGASVSGQRAVPGVLFRDVTVAPGEVKDLGDIKPVPPGRDK